MLAPGTLLSSRYRIQSVLGQGGMGAVYLAHMEALGGKKVAVKEMELKGFSSDELEQAVKQFNKEASFLANLDHPNLVPVTDFFIEADKHYLVMSYVKGETLQQRLKAHGRAFTWDQVKVWADPLVEVLHYLHTQNPPILFRDLKPSNIMLEESGRLRLIDFGIARTAQVGDRTSTFLQGTGTSGFSPIEQYGGGQSTDQRSDIYALGATLYYLLTGKIPPDAVARISQGKELRPPSHINPSLPRGVNDLLVKSLAVKQQDRHNSMAEFRREMKAITDTEGVTEDFGATSPMDRAATPKDPVTAAVAITPGPSKAIKVEMFPTAPARSRQTHSYTPWVVGLGSLALAGFTIFAVATNLVGRGNEKAAANPQPQRTVVSRSLTEGDTKPGPALTEVKEREPEDKIEETLPEEAIGTRKPPPERDPHKYIEPLPEPVADDKSEAEKTAEAATAARQPSPQKKSPVVEESYPKADYPIAKKEPPAPRLPQEPAEQPVAKAPPPRKPPPPQNGGARYPYPPGPGGSDMDGWPLGYNGQRLPADANGHPRPAVGGSSDQGPRGRGGPGRPGGQANNDPLNYNSR